MPDEKKKLSVLSLFSGCGGLDLGFEGGFEVLKPSIHPKSPWIEMETDLGYLLKKTKFSTVFANDIKEGAKTAWLNYFSKANGYENNVYHLESIVNLVNEYKSGELNRFPQNVDLVTGGFPCQDFSVAGKRLGMNSNKSHAGGYLDIDEPTEYNRGRLYIWMKEVVEIVKPKMFIAENVKGLANLSNIKDIIQHDFSSSSNNGYIVLPPKVLKATHFGVPQTRERIIFIGLNKSFLKNSIIDSLQAGEFPEDIDPYPEPTHGIGRLPVVTTKQAFVNLAEPDEEKNDPSQIYYSKAKYMGSHCQGQKEVRLDLPGPTIRSEHHGNIEFRRLSTEHGGENFSELSKGFVERRMTLRECARIQTFPDNFDFVIPNIVGRKKFLLSPSEGYKVLGNAVPPLLGYHLAKRIEKIWDRVFK